MGNTPRLQDAIGSRGEAIVRLCLTNYSTLARPLFRPGFLGDKWPAIDFYVELDGVKGARPYFFVQVKSTASPLAQHATHLRISSAKHDIVRLLEMSGPTYVLGVHEPSHRVFAKSVHQGMSTKSITRIELSHELTIANLIRLYNEVRDYWRSVQHKPFGSVFA
jgi:hypothetical protein